MKRPYAIVPLARISKIFGKKGEVSVRLYDSFCDEPNFEEPFFVGIDGLEVPLFLRTFTRKGNSGAVMSFEDIDSEYRVGELLGKELYTYAETPEPEKDELYYEDLAGYTLTDGPSGRRGIIADYIEHPDNPLFAVDIEGTEVMIPAADDLIVSVDPETRTVETCLPEGLIDLYLFPDE